MSVALNIVTVFAFMLFTEPLMQEKIFQPYLELFECLFRNAAKDQAIAKMYFAIVQFAHPDSMTSTRLAKDLYIKVWKAVDIFKQLISKYILSEKVDCFIFQNFRKQWTTNPNPGLSIIAAKVKLLLAIHKKKAQSH